MNSDVVLDSCRGIQDIPIEKIVDLVNFEPDEVKLIKEKQKETFEELKEEREDIFLHEYINMFKRSKSLRTLISILKNQISVFFDEKMSLSSEGDYHQTRNFGFTFAPLIYQDNVILH